MFVRSATWVQSATYPHRSVLGFSFAVALASFRLRFSCREAAAVGLSTTSVRAEAAAARRRRRAEVDAAAELPHLLLTLDGHNDASRLPFEVCWPGTNLLAVRADSPH